jgi:hypothetical protein
MWHIARVRVLGDADSIQSERRNAGDEEEEQVWADIEARDVYLRERVVRYIVDDRCSSPGAN